VTELDENGDVLATFTDANLWPCHLSADSEGHLLVADYGNQRILLLDSKLHQERVLVDTDSQVQLRWPKKLSYDELTSRLFILHSSSNGEESWQSSVISQVSLR